MAYPPSAISDDRVRPQAGDRSVVITELRQDLVRVRSEEWRRRPDGGRRRGEVERTADLVHSPERRVRHRDASIDRPGLRRVERLEDIEQRPGRDVRRVQE